MSASARTLTAGARRCVEFMRDRRFHTAAELEQECLVTWHSRKAELTSAGYVIEKRTNHGATGRAKFSYRLVQTALARALQDDELASLEEHGAAASCSSSDAAPAEQLTVGADSEPPATDRSCLPHATLNAEGDSSAEGERIPPSAEPAEFIDGAGTAPYLNVDECPAVGDVAADVSAAGLFFEVGDDPGDAGWRESIPAESWGAV